MKIEAVDFFYLSMPKVTDAGDGSQDALLVRVAAGGHIGWGECEAAPLPSIAAFICPMSHGACKPVSASVLGQRLEGPPDIARMAALVELESMDLLQAAHTFSGIEMAMWDVLGKARGEPVWRLLGYERAYPKTPYASQLFGDTPEETFVGCRAAREAGFRAVKCGWGPFGKTSLKADKEQLKFAREGVKADGILLVDAGQIWRDDVEAARQRLDMLEEFGATWLEEPFHGGAYKSYAALAGRVKLAGGEASHNFYMAQQLIDYGSIDFVQIDTGRIGGIGPAKKVADYAVAKGITYVNHTFTSHLALSASLQPYAGLSAHEICEFPFKPQSVAWDMCGNHLGIDGNGQVNLGNSPGLGIDIDTQAAARYLVDVEIAAKGKVLYRTPQLA